MSEFLRWPYDEVSVDVSPDGKSVAVTSPWLRATVEVPEGNADELRALAQKLTQKELTANDLGLVNGLFRELERYPFSYILPTLKEHPELDSHAARHPRLATDSIESLLGSALGMMGAEDAALEPADAPQIARKLRPTWAWDWDAAGAFAKVGDKIHPESLFSVARRFHLLDCLSTNRGSQIFEGVKELRGEEFRLAAGILVRQNHYVTQQCREALLPAVQIAGRARPLVEQFLKQENGHDRILGIAMQSFGQDPESVPVSPQTKCLMSLLRFAAGHNFLAFAMAVDCFERSTYEDTDPLAKLLLQGGLDKAAKQVNRHMEINDAGEHENVACGFLRYMAPCDPEYAQEALRITEVISLLANSVPESAIELYQALRESPSPRVPGTFPLGLQSLSEDRTPSYR